MFVVSEGEDSNDFSRKNYIENSTIVKALSKILFLLLNTRYGRCAAFALKAKQTSIHN